MTYTNFLGHPSGVGCLEKEFFFDLFSVDLMLIVAVFRKYTPEGSRLEHNSLEVWFRSFSFPFMGDL